MEQLLLNKTERRKIYWWIYLSTLAACLLSTAIAVALAELPFVNEVIYEENSVPDKPVMTNAGQNLYMTVFLHNGIILLFNQKKQRAAF